MNIIIPGQYPRSETLVAATRRFERKRLELEQLQQVVQEDTQALYAIQEGLKYRTTGLLQWQDLLRPYVELIEQASSGPLVRFYETNCFWRELVCEGSWELSSHSLDAWVKKWFFAEGLFKAEEPLVWTLPFIFLFRQFAKKASLETAATILKEIGCKLLSYPNKTLCLFEPSIGWNLLTSQERRVTVSLVQELKQSSPNPLFLCTAFFSVEEELEFLYELPVDGIGIDFYANSVAILKEFPKDKALLAGVLSTHTTAIEKRQQFERFKQLLDNTVSIPNLYFTSSGVSELLPRVIMDQKLKALKEWMHDSSFAHHS